MIFKIINERELKTFITEVEKDLQTEDGTKFFLKEYFSYITQVTKKESEFIVSLEGYAFCTVSFHIKQELIPEDYLRELTKKAEEE